MSPPPGSSFWEVTDRRRRRFWERVWERMTAPQLFVASFMALVLLGTLGFRFLPIYTGEGLGWLDSLFTATSAVCVTGLIVVDTATYFTAAGQAFILLLIQLGGLGIITFTSLILIALGRRFGLRHQSIASSMTEVAPHVDSRHLLRDVVRFTFGFELIGAILLFVLWAPEMGVKSAIGHSVFHSVSAFCNAGFSTFSTSLVGFQEAPFVLGVVMLLIVLGGIGFLTIEEIALWERARRSEERFRLSLNSRLILTTTAILLVVGWVFFGIFEWQNALEGLPLWAKVENALFASVTTRTAGFNTFNYADATDSTNFLTILLMFVGGSPGSTAGGLKTTTLALVVLLAVARLHGRELPSAWNRSIGLGTTQRAVGLFVFAVMLVTLGIFVLINSESFVRASGGVSFMRIVFESVSAFNTVGLSMDATGGLSSVGRVTTVLLMFIGRVGPLTVAASLARGVREGTNYRYAMEDVSVG